MSKIKFELTFDTESYEFSVVNTETGEIQTCKVSKKKKSNKNESPIPTLTLESNKYILNQAAIDALEVQPDDKIDIKYEKQGKQMIPVIANDEVWQTHSGNRLTKSYTVAFRGSKNEQLSKYGTTFTLIPHEKEVGRFYLDNGTSKEEESTLEDEFDDLQDIIDNPDDTEIESALFNFDY